MDIEDYLPDGHLPVYGSEVSPESFVRARHGDGWEVAAVRRDGTAVTYRLDLDGDLARVVTVGDAAQVPVRMGAHPFSKELVGELASVVDWVDWIALEDAAGRCATRTDRWAGDDLDAMGRRAELDVVAFEDFEVAVGQLDTFAMVRTWLDQALATSQVRIELASILELRHRDGDRLRDQVLFLRHLEDDEPVGFFPIPVTTDVDPASWLTFAWSSGTTALTPEPWVNVEMSGSTKLRSEASWVLSWSELQASDASLLTGAGATPVDDWLVLHVVGTDIALAFPREGANLAVRVDGDGSRVTLAVHPSAEREAHHRRRDRFERRWGRWLDEDVVLTDAELLEGIKRAEAGLGRVLDEGSE